jgi:Zn-dependent membrane protease YugP
MLLDSDYYLLALPPLALTGWACWNIFSARRAASRITAASGITAGQAARTLLDEGRAGDVNVVPISGPLANHYDAARRQLRLAAGVSAGRSLAALGIAAHEAGHALQDAERFPGLYVRNLLVPAATLGSILVWVLILSGLLLDVFRLFVWGVFASWLAVGLQLLNVPIERDAGRRGLHVLHACGLVTPEEEPVVKRVIASMAWTYVAATLTGFWKAPFEILTSRHTDDSIRARP